MKRTFAAKMLGLVGAMGLMAGCASKPPATAPTAAADPVLAKAEATPVSPLTGEGWKPLWDGQTLAGWRETDFAGHGLARCEGGRIVLETGASLTGINWTNEIPRMDYEIALEAMRVEGSDFFCGLTFPVGESYCSLILGGWGGGVVGLSSIDGQDASENETTQYLGFETRRWYRVRVRVSATKIQAWLDDQPIVNVTTTGRKISMRYGEIGLSKPLGLATWQTTGALRDIKIRRLKTEAGANE